MRHRNDAKIVDPQHLAAINVDKRAQPLDWVSIFDRLDQAAADLIRMPEHTTGPRIAAHQRDVGDAPFGECREKIGMRLLEGRGGAGLATPRGEEGDGPAVVGLRASLGEGLGEEA